MSRQRPFFKYHPIDALPALCGIGIVALIFWTFLCFDSLSWWVLAPAYVAIAWSYCWNMQSLSHNFIHNPFFSWRLLNRAFSVLETFALGVPHVFYHHYHLNHHFGDNDRRGPDGRTRDWSSMSHRAMMLPWWPAWSVSLPPLPPTPTQAMFSCSLGDLLSARVRPPATQKPKPARALSARK